MNLLTITLSDPFAELGFPIPATLGSASLEALVPMGELLLSGNTVRVPSILKL